MDSPCHSKRGWHYSSCLGLQNKAEGNLRSLSPSSLFSVLPALPMGPLSSLVFIWVISCPVAGKTPPLVTAFLPLPSVKGSVWRESIQTIPKVNEWLIWLEERRGSILSSLLCKRQWGLCPYSLNFSKSHNIPFMLQPRRRRLFLNCFEWVQSGGLTQCPPCSQTKPKQVQEHFTQLAELHLWMGESWAKPDGQGSPEWLAMWLWEFCFGKHLENGFQRTAWLRGFLETVSDRSF